MEVDQASATTSTCRQLQQQQDSASSSPSDKTVEEVQGDHQDDFLQTGRVGRRNAVPDIKTDPSSTVSTADLPMELEKLSCAAGSSDTGEQPMDTTPTTSLPGTSSSGG